MTSARAIEYRIIQHRLRRREAEGVRARPRLAERLIMVAAATVSLLVLGAYAQELLWGLLAGATVLTLGTR